MSRRRIRDIRHDEFIAATIRSVHQRGFGRVTMADIAKDADSSASSIAYYFGSKEKLMEATMRHLLGILKAAMLDRYARARSPQHRLRALVEANFDDRLFTTEQCSVWIQFWSHAPYAPALSRLHRINLSRVRSHMRAELRLLLPQARRETVREALQAYMDGIWLEAAQSPHPVDPAQTRAAALRVVTLLLDS